ncbi:hypothetical protein FS837_003500 [Tulasnella sp. UAMH 9824]|nr:hypothetical protein FS837_003500 [Tulasnella sp. UAMH 9824]
MAATRRIPLSLLFFTTLTTAIELIISGEPQPGEAITLTWDGVGPWSLDILTAASAEDSFTLYRSFNPITVTNAVWNVDVAAGTLVEFEITDSTGDGATQFVQIDDGGAALSSSSVASQSSESVASTQSLSSVFSERRVYGF